MTLKIWAVLKVIMAIFIIFGGCQYFVKPLFYLLFVPDFLIYKQLIVYISGVVEILIGVLLFTKQFQGVGALAYFIMMLVFLPIHVMDFF